MIRDVLRKPWLWSFVAAFLVWLATMAFTGFKGGGELISVR